MKKGVEIQARSFEFAAEIVTLVDVVFTRGQSAAVMAKQLLRSATSIGANLEEADAAQSRADFIAKCGIALREARESHYWLRLMRRTRKIVESDRADFFLDECNQMVAVLTAIVRNTRRGPVDPRTAR